MEIIEKSDVGLQKQTNFLHVCTNQLKFSWVCKFGVVFENIRILERQEQFEGVTLQKNCSSRTNIAYSLPSTIIVYVVEWNNSVKDVNDNHDGAEDQDQLLLGLHGGGADPVHLWHLWLLWPYWLLTQTSSDILLCNNLEETERIFIYMLAYNRMLRYVGFSEIKKLKDRKKFR